MGFVGSGAAVNGSPSRCHSNGVPVRRRLADLFEFGTPLFST
jgi:hypothetical protein